VSSINATIKVQIPLGTPLGHYTIYSKALVSENPFFGSWSKTWPYSNFTLEIPYAFSRPYSGFRVYEK